MPRSTASAAHQRLCELLIESRRAAGLTQVEVAERLDRPQSFVSKYEAGERRLDVVEFLEVMDSLNADPYDLLRRLKHPG